MTNTQSNTPPQALQEGDSSSSNTGTTLDAIITAPVLSLRSMLFSLYAEGDPDLRARIDELAAAFRNLPACRVDNMEPHPDAQNIAAPLDREGSPVQTLKVCDHCFEVLMQIVNTSKTHVAILVSSSIGLCVYGNWGLRRLLFRDVVHWIC